VRAGGEAGFLSYKTHRKKNAAGVARVIPPPFAFCQKEKKGFSDSFAARLFLSLFLTRAG
jgi:hypothetical protein